MIEWQETSVGRIPISWDFKKISDTDLHIGDGNYSLNYPRQKELLASGVPFISSNDLSNRRIRYDNLRYISPEQHSILLKGHIKEQDVLVVVRGYGVGDVALVNKQFENANINSQLAFLRSKGQHYGPFLYYSLLNYKKRGVTEMYVSGSAQPQITVGQLNEIYLVLPPFPEQKAIAAVLSSLDDKIDLLHRQNKTLEALAQTLFRQWFIEEAQEEWEVVTIGEYSQINKSSVDKNYPHCTIKYLDTGSITEGKIDGYQTVSLQDSPNRAKRIVTHNDVIISTVRPNQRHYGIVKNPKPNTIVSTGFCVLTCSKIDPHFIYIFLTLPEMTEYLQIIAEASTSAYPSLKRSDIASVEFHLPPKQKLDEFSNLTYDIWAKIDHNENQIRTLEKMRDTLLPKLMSGVVRVKH